MKWIRALIVSAVVCLACVLLLLTIIAFVVSRSGALPRGSLALVTTLAGCGAAFLSGLAASLSMREKGLLLGLAGGAMLLLAAAGVSLLVYQAELSPASAGKAAAILLSGAIGGILGANRKQKVKF